MEGRVKLFDANGIEIGETYTRRARQLVKQQRAVWADDSHTAIRFMPDTDEDWEMSMSPEPPPHPAASAPPPDKDGLLYAMAEKRLSDRRRLIWHTVWLLPVYVLIPILLALLTGGRWDSFAFFVLGLTWGMWTMAYYYRVRDYFRERGVNLRPSSWEANRKLRLQAEVDRLKRMGYTD